MEIILSQYGPWTLIAGAAWLLATGRLVPRSQLRDRERLIGLYRDAFEREHKARELADKQLSELMEYGRTANSLLNALPVPAQGGPDVATRE